MFKQWALPEDVCTAIRYQNEPSYNGEHNQLSAMLFVASRMLSTENLNDAPLEPIPPELIASLQLDMSKAEEALEKVLDAKDDLQQMAHQLNS